MGLKLLSAPPAWRLRTGILLVAGTAIVLAGLGKMLARRSLKDSPGHAALPVPARSSGVRTDYYTIRQTRSELGYVYWVLQGHGRFASFALFDTWREAMDAAIEKLTARSTPDSSSSSGMFRGLATL